MANSLGVLGVLVVGVVFAVASAAESGPPVESQRRAATLADIGRLRLELGTREDTAAAAEALKEAVKLDPANLRARFWLGMATLRAGAPGFAEQLAGKLDADAALRAGLEFEAVFRLAALERSAESEDLRIRAISILDLCAEKLPPGEKRFGPWWKKRRAELFAEQPTANLIHYVALGETLAAIARRYYGDPARAAAIVEANPGISPAALRAGQKLTIPGVKLKPPAPRPAPDRLDRELLQQLASAALAAERRGAAARLAERECRAAVPELVGALRSDESQWVRAECARALGALGAREAEPALCAALRADLWPLCRLEAARALGRVGGQGAHPALLAALDDSSPQVGSAAARALGALGVAEASAPLVAALAAHSEPLRRAAAAALCRLAAQGRLAEADRARIASLAKGGAASDRAAALLALAGTDPAAAAKALLAALDDADEPVRRAAAEGLAAVASAGAALDAKAAERLAAAAESAEDPAVILGAASAAARAGRGTAAERRGLLALAALLDEGRAIYWGDADEPGTAGGFAARELAALTGARLGAERSAWTAWIQREKK